MTDQVTSPRGYSAGDAYYLAMRDDPESHRAFRRVKLSLGVFVAVLRVAFAEAEQRSQTPRADQPARQQPSRGEAARRMPDDQPPLEGVKAHFARIRGIVDGGHLPDLTALELRALLVFLTHSDNDTGDTFVGVGTIGEKIGCENRNRVRQAIRRLEERGIVSTIDPGGLDRPAVRRLLIARGVGTVSVPRGGDGERPQLDDDSRPGVGTQIVPRVGTVRVPGVGTVRVPLSTLRSTHTTQQQQTGGEGEREGEESAPPPPEVIAALRRHEIDDAGRRRLIAAVPGLTEAVVEKLSRQAKSGRKPAALLYRLIERQGAELVEQERMQRDARARRAFLAPYREKYEAKRQHFESWIAVAAESRPNGFLQEITARLAEEGIPAPGESEAKGADRGAYIALAYELAGVDPAAKHVA